jgi:hypothetical protein
MQIRYLNKLCPLGRQAFHNEPSGKATIMVRQNQGLLCSRRSKIASLWRASRPPGISGVQPYLRIATKD